MKTIVFAYNHNKIAQDDRIASHRHYVGHNNNNKIHMCSIWPPIKVYIDTIFENFGLDFIITMREQQKAIHVAPARIYTKFSTIGIRSKTDITLQGSHHQEAKQIL